MREIKLQDLKSKTPAELVSFAEENGVENASTMRKQAVSTIKSHDETTNVLRKPQGRYCLAGSSAGAAGVGSAAGVLPSEGAAQSPAQILVPFTVPTSLQPIGAAGCLCGLVAALGVVALGTAV